MQRKKIDSRIRVLIENAVRTQHRSLFLVVGDRGRDHVMHFHYMLSKAKAKARPSVLWCFKNELGFTSDRKKRQREAKKKGKEEMDEFELFLSATNIRFCYYKETENIMGNTYGMCVLQDFEAITPNILARTVETVNGGGVVMVLLRSMRSLRQMYSMAMDVHQRYTANPSHQPIRARFNERFLLSLARCKSALVLDDDLNVLPISSAARSIQAVDVSHAEMKDEHIITPEEQELRRLQQSMKDTPTAGTLLQLCRTPDQAKAVLQCVDSVSDRNLRTTVAVTAGRGRGKSAALGLAVGGAVGYGYANMFVTSPAPQNLATFFEFVVRSLKEQGLVEHQDYEVVQGTSGELRGCVVRINVFREHRQTVQYIRPSDSSRLAQAELLVIDEAAAIPLPLVRKLLGPYLVFMASTINGYEGTGRSLSLKLIQQLREQSGPGPGSRTLREITLTHPIRYAAGDEVEQWLHDLLCLDATEAGPASKGEGCPHPSECELYHVNRDTLFSYHRTSEVFLHRLMALFVASHYKNTPNDLQLLSDAPNHEVFVLLGPVNEQRGVPDILCAVQVSFEGGIESRTLSANMVRGTRPPGDLIPYTVSTQYQDTTFGRMRGVRVVRIATHPEYQRMGYGSRTLHLLLRYFAGFMTTDEAKTHDDDKHKPINSKHDADDHVIESQRDVKLNEHITPRKKLPPLLQAAVERRAEQVDWMGVSYGLTLKLFNFWHRAGFKTVYVRLTPNDLTGEHTAIMLHDLQGNNNNNTKGQWLHRFHTDFRGRFAGLLGYQFRSFHPTLALSVLAQTEPERHTLSCNVLMSMLSEYDVRRLESYSRNLVDYHLVLDVLPTLCRWVFTGRLGVSLSFSIAAVVLAMGLQHKTVDVVAEEVKLESNQVLALFNKAMRKVHKELERIRSQDGNSNEKQQVINDADRIKSSKKKRKKNNNNNMKTERGDDNSDSGVQQDDSGYNTDTDDDNDNDSDDDEHDGTDHIAPEYKPTLRQEQSRLVKSVLSHKDHYTVQGTEEEWQRAVAEGGSSGVSVRKEGDSGRGKKGKKRKGKSLYDDGRGGKNKRRRKK